MAIKKRKLQNRRKGKAYRRRQKPNDLSLAPWKHDVHKFYGIVNANRYGTACIISNATGLITTIGTNTTRITFPNPPVLGVDSMFAFQFSLDQTTLYQSGLLGQFSAFRLDKIIVTAYPVLAYSQFGQQTVNNLIAIPTNRFYSLIDIQDSIVPTNVTGLRTDPRCKEHEYGNPSSKVIKWHITPRCANVSWTGSLPTNSNIAPKNQWQNITGYNTTYYGLKLGVPSVANILNNTFAFDIEVEYCMSMKLSP